MDCNKEEAMRAKNIAEKKMLNDDFEGARKIAQKAKKLFPDLDNISQLLAVCDVHCSAQNKIYGSEKDWYGILQIEILADEVTIRKQYRKLALLLHPDKNNYPGAEAAFKLIGEANRVLCDKGKRSSYDKIRCGTSVRTVVPGPQSHQVHPNVRNSHGAQSKTPNVSTHQFNGFNQNQPTKPVSASSQTFWTSCPICSTKYQYYRDFVNKSLRCQNCSHPFIAFDLGSNGPTPVYKQTTGYEGTARVSKRGKHPDSDQGKIPVKTSRMGAETSRESPSYHPGSVGKSTEKMGEKRKECSTGAPRGSKIKDKNSHVNAEDNDVGVGMSKVDAAKGKQSGNLRNKNKNKRRKFVVNSSESNDMLSDSEDVFEEIGSIHAGKQYSEPDNNNCRRSSRLKQNVSYNENALHDDLVSPLSKSCDGKDKQKESVDNLDKAEATFTKETTGHRSEFAEGSSHEDVNHLSNVEEADTLDTTANKFNVVGDTESNHSANSASEPELYECPEPEFNDFDKNKDEKCFSVGQIWACYDTIDGQPRFYAQIKKVLSPGFKLRISWLEADPQSKDETDWVKEQLPVGCGTFVLGETDETSDRLTFSHQIYFEKGVRRGSYRIYPKSGEIWALFKDWDIKWSLDPENHHRYVHEIVEILSDFGDDTSGIKVSYLTRLKGFVSLFERTRGVVECLIPSSELLRFSHRIPSFRMTGAEREGVPEGSFELDPAALPTDPRDCWQPEVTAKHQRTPRELNGITKNSPNVSCSPCKSREETAKHLHGSENVSGYFTPSKGEVSSGGHGDKHLGTSTTPIDLTESPSVQGSFSFRDKVSEEVFYNFNLDKSEGKFQLGQIWAVYSSVDKLPNNYAKVLKIETSPFKLQVAFIEPCRSTKQSVSCGMFKVQNAKQKLLSPNSFSHLMNVKFANKVKIEIYPKEGEIWAIHKNWNADLPYPDPKNCEFDIVEIVKHEAFCTEAACLVQLPGFKSVFRARRRQRSNTGILKIPRGELLRFSHQIPAFQLTGENDGSLRGCWELDHAALPSYIFRKKQDELTQ